jgi:hypothetical protein
MVTAPPRPEPPSAATDQPETCPRCGTPNEPGQEYCLECGLRLPQSPHGIVASLRGAWRRRLRWYPGDWIWATLGLLGVAAIGAAVAVAASNENPTTTATIVATTSPGVITRQAVRTTPSPEAPPVTTTAPAAPTAPPPTPRRQRKLIVWPTGQSGWTIVLRSETSQRTAQSEARRALRAGLRDVGVLDSSDYTSLHPGYFVVFSGVYKSQGDAEAALEDATSGGYDRAYVRPVSP